MQAQRSRHDTPLIRPVVFEGPYVEKAEIQNALLDTGAVLIHSAGVADAAGLKSFAETFAGGPLLDYVGGTSPRTKYGVGVYNSTEYPPEMQLDLHNEMSYLPTFPSHIYFYCQVPPLDRGETTLGDGRQILRWIDPHIVEEFERRGGVRYERFLVDDPNSPYSWQAAFETTVRIVAENACRARASEFYWDGSTLCIHQTRPATAKHPVMAADVWFNQAEGFHHSVLGEGILEELNLLGLRPRLDSRFGDGTEFDAEMLAHIRSVKNELTYHHRWQQDDLLILDNVLTMHGRAPFAGPRKIIVSMS